MRQWNQLDESIKSSPAVSVFKREINALDQAAKKITVLLPRNRGSTTVNPG